MGVQFKVTDKQTKCEKESGSGEGKREWARPRFGCRSGAEAKLKRLVSQRKPQLLSQQKSKYIRKDNNVIGLIFI